MAQCRDWLSTLWPASYKGVPFYFETDTEEGGLDQVVHEFPKSDKPFVEDMGEGARYFSGTAYVHGDDVDAREAAFKAALTAHGPGVLVLPLQGPVLVHAMPFTRTHERDRLGYVAFEIKFVREGAATAQISVPFALNQAFVAADAAAAAIVASFAASLVIFAQPDLVVSAAVDGVAGAAAALDVVRTSYRVDPTASATLRDTLAQIVATAPEVITPEAVPGAAVTTLAQSLVDATRALADALPAPSSARAMSALVDQFAVTVAGTPYATASLAKVAVNAAAAARIARLAALTAYAESILRQSYGSRPEGVAARASVAAKFEAALYETTGAENAALFLTLDDLRGKVIDYLAAAINDLAPVVKVEAPRILPSLFLAWRLYADPLRADELVARNNVRHPSFMPRELTALSR